MQLIQASQDANLTAKWVINGEAGVQFGFILLFPRVHSESKEMTGIQLEQDLILVNKCVELCSVLLSSVGEYAPSFISQ